MKCETRGIFKSFKGPAFMYPKFVQIFQTGPKCTINFYGLASFQNNDCF